MKGKKCMQNFDLETASKGASFDEQAWKWDQEF
jgi:hypothetical protein